jgi:putative transposase
VFVIDLASRRVHVLGSTPHPTELFMEQMVRLVTADDESALDGHRALICDRDRKWSRAVRQELGDAGIRVVFTPGARRTRMRMLSGSSDQSKKSASTG